MQEEPADISRGELATLLREQWLLAEPALQYLPVGFGGYHWLATEPGGPRWFVTVSEVPAGDRGRAGQEFTAAMETAASLASAGLNFVVAPVRTRAGHAVCWLRREHAVTVFTYSDATPGHFGDALTTSERRALLGLLARLHVPDRRVSTSAVPFRRMELAERELLDLSMRERGAPWQGGPYAGPARELLNQYRPFLVRGLAEFDALVETVRRDGRNLVITHGEPHPGNILRAESGPLLVDWDTVGLAPPERDLWWVLTGGSEDAARYTEQTGQEVSHDALALYRLRWSLDDISLFLAEFRNVHSRSPDTEVSFAGFRDGLISLGGNPAEV